MDDRCIVYRDLFKVELSEENLHLIRKSAHYNQPISDNRFRVQTENKYGFKFGQAKRGRPKKVTNKLRNA